MIEVVSFASGVRLVYQRNDSNVVHFGFMVKVGSRSELLPGEGKAHLLEHMMFKGTESFSFEDLLMYVEGVGGEFNAYTSREETCFYISIHKDYFKRTIEVLSSIFYSSTLPESELIKEKQVVIDEIGFYEDSPVELLIDDFEEKFFEGYELSNRILGSVQSVESVSRESLYAFYKENYLNHNVVLSFVGSIPLSEISSICSDFFQIDQKVVAPRASQMVNQPVQTKHFNESTKKKTSQTHYVAGCRSVSVKDNDRYLMYLFNNLFGGSSFNSILNMSLRERRGLTYNVESNFIPYSDIGLFYIYFGTDKKNVSKCISIIDSELSKIIDGGLPPEMFSLYKKQIIGHLALQADNYLNEMITNAKSLLFSGNVLTYPEVMKIYDSIDYDQFLGFIKKSDININSMSSLRFN